MKDVNGIEIKVGDLVEYKNEYQLYMVVNENGDVRPPFGVVVKNYAHLCKKAR